MNRAAQHLLSAIEGGLAESRGHLIGGAVCRSVRHGLGHHGELLRHRHRQGYEPCRGRAGHCRGAGRDFAIGLAAAIPATIGYNRIGASLARAGGQSLQHLIEEDAVTLTAHPDAARRAAEQVR